MALKPGWIEVALVEDEPAIRHLVMRWLEKDGFTVHAFADGESFLAELGHLLPDAVILDLGLPGMDGFEILSRVKAAQPDVPVIMMTGYEETETVVRAIRVGAFEYLVKPVSETRLRTTLQHALEQRALNERLRELEVRVEGEFVGITGSSPPMLALFANMRRVSSTDVSVVIRGESGSGKELVASALHRGGRRAAGPFIAINCAAVPESLQESELFGHESGAFTGATKRRIGHFEQAHGGTLFLDEVGELSSALQAKLLRVLQERVFHRLGGSEEIRSDFRLMVATHRDLEADVRQGRFREDLYYRLAVFELTVPPLRERGADIGLLARRMARELGTRIRGEPCEVLPESEAVLASYGWPGNVRELENVMQRALVVSSGRQIPPWALTQALRTGSTRPPPPAAHESPAKPISNDDPDAAWDRLAGGLTLAQLEHRAAHAAVRRHAGNVSRAAKELGITRATLYRKLGGD